MEQRPAGEWHRPVHWPCVTWISSVMCPSAAFPGTDGALVNWWWRGPLSSMLLQDSWSITFSAGAAPWKDPYPGVGWLGHWKPCDGERIRKWGCLHSRQDCGQDRAEKRIYGVTLWKYLLNNHVKEEFDLICMSLKCRFKETDTWHHLRDLIELSKMTWVA